MSPAPASKTANRKAATKRQPDETRQQLLQAAFEEIYRRGFHAASLDKILAETKVTKGALYHHFKNKAELGYAVVEEIIKPWLRSTWQPVMDSEDPIEAAIGVVKTRFANLTAEQMEYGCPFNNLVTEMCARDEGFRTRLAAGLTEFREGVAHELRRGQKNGSVREDLNVAQAAAFFVASFQGTIGVSKAARDKELFEHAVGGMISYLETLRPPQAAPKHVRN